MQSALTKYLCSHPSLQNEILNKTGVVFGIEDDNDSSMEDDSIDDSDVPSSVIVGEALGESPSDLPADMVPSDNRVVGQWDKDGAWWMGCKW